MKGDFTRDTFAPAKSYTRVLRQQGRVDLDSDWNEQGAILDHLRRSSLGDVIGRTGVPRASGGLDLSISGDGATISVGPGRVYVDGILCDLDQAIEIQVDSEGRVTGDSQLLLLDVWERHVTALEDPAIREVALGGPDTTTRVQTVCRLRLLDGEFDCDSADAEWLPASSGGRLSTGVVTAPPAASPCDIPAAGGYRGLENRLYRVEIHDAGDVGAATFKWSRDNGSVAFAVEEFPASMTNRVRLRRLGRDQVLTLRTDDWVEIIDDEREMSGEPGFIAQVDEVDDATRLIKLDRDLPAAAFSIESHARIRRWDHQDGATSGGTITTAAGPIDLEDGIQISFTGEDFRVGDFWMFAARTATREVERLAGAEPQGMQHHFCRLGTVRWTDTGGDSLDVAFEPCDLEFPPLNDITARDVGYDPSACDLDGPETVQDALDRLCRERDLRHHNRHLHGWGIVCGLQVHCGGDDGGKGRRSVSVQSGYALDCEGNDLILDQSVPVDVMNEVAALQQESPNDPVLDEAGNGEVCILLQRDEKGEVGFAFEKYRPEAKGWESLLQGTLLYDFYQKCIVRVIDWIRDEFTPDFGEEKQLVGPTQRRLTSFLNLIVQLWNPTHGRFVFLSRREHDYLRAFYNGLRGLLQSRTFCAMFENARPFPEYPFEDDAHSTIFGKGNHSRLRIDAKGAAAYTIGRSNRVHRYDLSTREMIADSEFPGGEGAIVRDVSPVGDGRTVHAIATVNQSTLFATGEVGETEIAWKPVSVICTGQLVTLARWENSAGMIFAIGKGLGLYAFDPTQSQVKPELIHPFNAVGHLVIDQRTGMAWATAASDEAGITDQYDRLVRVNLADQKQETRTIHFQDSTGNEASGSDDIALDPDAGRVAAVIDGPNGFGREIVLIPTRDDNSAALVVPGLEDTELRLGYSSASRHLVVAHEDSFRLSLIQTEQGYLLPDFRHPVQISPSAIAFGADGSEMFVLNEISNTINTIPSRYLSPDNAFDNEALASYRDGVIDAFMDLLGGFLQYLKDCFCDHFLVNCPDCSGDEKIYLGCISIRDREVFRVCNFARRRYVKSFPTMEYWLSVVPIWPVLRQWVAKFCCSVPVEFFGQRAAPQAFRYEKQTSASTLRQGLGALQGLDLSSITRMFDRRSTLLRSVGGDWLRTGSKRSSSISVDANRKTVSQAEVVGQSVDAASERLAEARVEVVDVQSYDANAAPSNLIKVATAPTNLAEGQKVQLYQEGGQVKYYALVNDRSATFQPTGGEMSSSAEVESLRREIESLRVERDNMATEATGTQFSSELETLRSELQTVKASYEKALSDRDQEIAVLTRTTEEMKTQVNEFNDIKKRISRLEKA